jgi:hypothetical protein
MQHGLQSNMLCKDCVEEGYLSAMIADHGQSALCDYCGNEAKTFELERICDEVDGAFQRHFTRARMEMNGYEWAAHKDPESSFEFEPSGELTVYAIMNAAEVSESIAEDIQKVLEERYSDFESAQLGETTEYDSELHYEERTPDGREWQQTWHSFERSLKTEARFFSAKALETLNSVFDGIDAMATRHGGSLIVVGGPGTPFEYLYRARAFQSQGKLRAALLRPDKELGPPPSAFAASGRMNARGISVFYGATDPETAVAEVRPPVGSEVALARFQVVRPLRLLDLTALGGVIAKGSYFDPEYAAALDRMTFLRSLSRRMARPVMPDDQDADYLPTQAIADFLATDTVTPLDGIIFPSVQVAGGKQNIVLFHKASLVEKLVIPPGAETDVDTYSEDDDGPYREYQVVWRLEPVGETEEAKAGKRNDPLEGFLGVPSAAEDDVDFGSGRDVTLRITPKDLEVRIVNAVVFETEDHKVGHLSYTKPARADF